MNTALGTAWLLGLFGSAHCIGMCGGLSAALAFAMPSNTPAMRKLALLWLMATGRIGSYAALGAIGGALLPSGEGADSLPVARIAAGILLVLMGLSIAGWRTALAPLERAGHRAWQRVGPRALRIARPDSAAGALLAGAAWGWLPCGLVYSALAWASSGGDAPSGAALMAAFGFGTLPAVIASGALAARLRTLLQRRELRLAIGLLVTGFGIWTLAMPLLHAGHASHHTGAMSMEHRAHRTMQGHPHHDGHGSPGHTDQKR